MVELFFGRRGWRCPRCDRKIRPRCIGKHISKCSCGFKVKVELVYKQVIIHEIEIMSINPISQNRMVKKND